MQQELQCIFVPFFSERAVRQHNRRKDKTGRFVCRMQGLNDDTTGESEGRQKKHSDDWEY